MNTVLPHDLYETLAVDHADLENSEIYELQTVLPELALDGRDATLTETSLKFVSCESYAERRVTLWFTG